MSNSKLQIQIASLIILKELKKLKDENEKKKKIKRLWVKPSLLKREEHGLESYLLKGLLCEDNEDKDTQNFNGFTIHDFEFILAKIFIRIKKTDTVMRHSISPRTKLAITLRYIATGDSYRSLEFLSRVSRNSMQKFVPLVLAAIYETMQPIYLKKPDSESEWTKISNDFNTIWGFPHTVGVLDGKHIKIKTPGHLSSYNCKGFYSIVLFALVDAHCRFLLIDVDCNKSKKDSDSTIYYDSYLYKSLENGTLNIPFESELEGCQGSKVPFFFIGNDSFPLNKNLMKPFVKNASITVQGEIFNSRLFHARKTVQCAFGKLANLFLIFHRPFDVLPDTADLIIKCCCVLHNYLTKEKTSSAHISDDEIEIVPLPETFSAIGPQRSQSYNNSYRIREKLANYFMKNDEK